MVLEVGAFMHSEPEVVAAALRWWATATRGSFIVIDTQEIVVFANAGAYDRMGMDPGRSSVVGSHIEHVFGYTGFTHAQLPILRSLHEGIPFHQVRTVTTKGVLMVDTAPIMAEGRVAGAVAMAIDCTEQVKRDADSARIHELNLVGEIAASIAHEIRNPLTTVRGFLQLLAKKPELAPYRKFTDLMTQEIDRACGIITTYLSLSRTAATTKRCCLATVVQCFAPVLNAEALVKSMRICYSLHSTTHIMANEAELRQLLTNLVKNALESMPLGGTVRLETWELADTVCLSVRDEGCGIPSELIPKLGTPFLTTKENGTGLGLAVCYRIAERHGAKITVDSSPLGSTFTVSFPKPAAPVDRLCGDHAR